MTGACSPAHPWLSGVTLGLALFGFALGTFLLIRNGWVYKTRMAILNDHSLEVYKRLPSYPAMMYRYCLVWRASWFLERFR